MKKIIKMGRRSEKTLKKKERKKETGMFEGEEILADSTTLFSFEKQHQGLKIPEDVSRS